MTEGLRPPYASGGDPTSRVVATAIHAGHDTRPEVTDLLAVDAVTRRREEDPYTDRIATCAEFRVLVNRSRFEVDLNRSRDEAVYRAEDDAWDLQVWREDPPAELVERSLDIYDNFYADLGAHLDRLAATGPFVVFDVHSYNHRRDGPDAECAPEEGNPDVNVGTGSMPDRWRTLADSFIAALGDGDVDGRPLDVRENIRFRGRAFPQWVHERYPDTGCALALEFKKTFMDEWTGVVDDDHLAALTGAMRNTIPSVLHALKAAA